MREHSARRLADSMYCRENLNDKTETKFIWRIKKLYLPLHCNSVNMKNKNHPSETLPIDNSCQTGLPLSSEGVF